MSRTLGAIHKLVGGELQGDPDRVIKTIAPLNQASDVSISYLASAPTVEFREHLANTKAGAVLLAPEFAELCPVYCISVDNPYLAYAQISELFDDRPAAIEGVHPSAVLGERVSLQEGVSIAANCAIGDDVSVGAHTRIGPNSSIGAGTVIGERCRLAANVVVYHKVHIGNAVELHSNSVIGADGFGFAPSVNGWKKIHQLGSVKIGDSVSVGASSTIDRGAIDDTVIADGVIIDNQVQIAHNVRIGKNTALAGCVGIAGSATIGANCTLGGGVGVAGHLHIADNVHLTGMTLVSRSIDQPGVYSSGMVFSRARTWKKNAVRFAKLDDMYRRLKKLERKLEGKLEENSAS